MQQGTRFAGGEGKKELHVGGCSAAFAACGTNDGLAGEKVGGAKGREENGEKRKDYFRSSRHVPTISARGEINGISPALSSPSPA